MLPRYELCLPTGTDWSAPQFVDQWQSKIRMLLTCPPDWSKRRSFVLAPAGGLHLGAFAFFGALVCGEVALALPYTITIPGL